MYKASIKYQVCLRYNIVQKGSVSNKYICILKLSLYILSKCNVTQNPKLECGVVFIYILIYEYLKQFWNHKFKLQNVNIFYNPYIHIKRIQNIPCNPNIYTKIHNILYTSNWRKINLL